MQEVLTLYRRLGFRRVPILMFLVFCSCGRYSEPDRRPACRTNLGLIRSFCAMYSDGHQGSLPKNLEDLYPSYIKDTRVLQNPRLLGKAGTGYVYFFSSDTNTMRPIVAEDYRQYENSEDIFVVYSDWAVRYVTKACLVKELEELRRNGTAVHETPVRLPPNMYETTRSTR
jgi:hypothetical protein